MTEALAIRTLLWVETLTRPRIIIEGGRFKVYVPRSGYVFIFSENDKGKLEKPKKSDRGKNVIDLYHHIQEGSGPEPPLALAEGAWRQGYAVWKEAKRRGIQEELFPRLPRRDL